MHNDHEKFKLGLSQSRKIRLKFFADDPRHEMVSVCGPLYYKKGLAEANMPDCYYFWDFEAKEGSNFIALVPSEIIEMELAGDSFSFNEITSISKRSNSD